MQDLRNKVDETSAFLAKSFADRKKLAERGQTAVLDSLKPIEKRVVDMKNRVS